MACILSFMEFANKWPFLYNTVVCMALAMQRPIDSRISNGVIQHVSRQRIG
jgi:hypothetical protein